MNVDQAHCSREQQSEQVKVVGSQARTIVLFTDGDETDPSDEDYCAAQGAPGVDFIRA